jgi:hypothetical protein
MTTRLERAADGPGPASTPRRRAAGALRTGAAIVSYRTISLGAQGAVGALAFITLTAGLRR